jgi:hypothetical protein
MIFYPLDAMYPSPADIEIRNGADVDNSVWPDEPDWLKKEREEARENATLRDRLLSVSDLEHLPTVAPLVDEILYRDTLAQLSGPPGSYKSFVAINLSCALAAGKNEFANHRIPKREKVVYVAAEGATGLRARILAWCQRHDTEPATLDGWLHILPLPVQLGASDEVTEAVEMVQEVEAGLLVLDTRARCTLGLEENSATEQGKAVEAAEALRRAAGCTVLVIHHSGRSGSNPRGSTAWDGAVWTDLRIVAPAPLTAQVTVEKHKDVPAGETYDYRLAPHTLSSELSPASGEDVKAVQSVFVPDVSSLQQSLVVFRSTTGIPGEISGPIAKKVADLCRNSCGTEGLTRAQLVRLAVDAGISQSHAYAAVNGLLNSGRLRNVGTGKRPRYAWFGP